MPLHYLFPYFSCLTYFRRTVLIHLNNTFFHILSVSDTWEEPYYFAFMVCFSMFHLSQKPERSLITFTVHYVFLYFICLRYLRRTILLHLINMFFRLRFVSDTWEEPYYFDLIIYFSVLHLSQKSEKNHVTLPQ